MQCQSGSWSFPFQGPVQNFMEDNQRYKNNKIKIPSFYITNSMITVYYFTYIIWLRMKNQHRWELSKKKRFLMIFPAVFYISRIVFRNVTPQNWTWKGCFEKVEDLWRLPSTIQQAQTSRRPRRYAHLVLEARQEGNSKVFLVFVLLFDSWCY